MARNRENLKKWRKDNYKKNRVVVLKKRKERYIRDPRNQMLTSARQRSKRDSTPFDLEVSDFTIPEVCPILGHKFEFGTRKTHQWAPTLDKRIPNLGYVKGNIQVISHKANLLKNNATPEELLKFVEYVLKNITIGEKK